MKGIVYNSEKQMWSVFKSFAKRKVHVEDFKEYADAVRAANTRKPRIPPDVVLLGPTEKYQPSKHPLYPLWNRHRKEMCSEWESFEQFVKDMGDKKKEGFRYLCRYNVEEQFSKENCFWSIAPNSKRYSMAGVRYLKDRRKWRARITIAGTALELGDFDRVEDAVAARRLGEKKRELYLSTLGQK